MFNTFTATEDVNPMSFEELTPLHAAAQLGHEEAPKKAEPRRGGFFGRAQKAASCPWEGTGSDFLYGIPEFIFN